MKRQRAYSLVELMVAMTLGLLILAGLMGIFLGNNRARNEIEFSTQQTENGRYALQLLTDDLSNANYLAELDPGLLTTPAAKPDPCSFAVTDLNSALSVGVQAYASGANPPGCVTDVRGGTDILVIRRASTCAVGTTDCDAQVTGAPYLQASTCTSPTELGSTNILNHYVLDTDTSKFTLHQKDCNPPLIAGTIAPLHQYRTNIYFIANNDKAGDAIPTLKRAELGANGFTIVPLVEGIENLHIEYGIDIPSGTPAVLSGTPAVYTSDPDNYQTCAPPVCMSYWRNIVAAKVYLLSRNINLSQGYTSNKVYNLGLKSDGTTVNAVGPFNDQYKRHVYMSLVRLNNTAGRNTP